MSLEVASFVARTNYMTFCGQFCFCVQELGEFGEGDADAVWPDLEAPWRRCEGRLTPLHSPFFSPYLSLYIYLSLYLSLSLSSFISSIDVSILHNTSRPMVGA